MWSSKAPILLLYVRLFGVKQWMRTICYLTLAITTIFFLVGPAVACAKCDLRGKPPSQEFLLACSNTTSVAGVVLGITAVITDAIVFVLPLPVIYQLKLAPQKKLGLLLVFMTGIL